ncbi:MAG TPA: hypothetical protein VEN31_08330, partial [Candidatus Bathyarchaeia archaeon]|nr:hypothetical protein [Candidatus Bathyarchaeia archaeon]
MSVHRPTRQLSPIASGLAVGAGVAVRVGEGLGVGIGVGLAVCGVMALGKAESARPTGAGVAAPPHAVSPPSSATPAMAAMRWRGDRVSFRVRFFMSQWSLRDLALRFKATGHWARSNWVALPWSSLSVSALKDGMRG